MLCRAAVSVTVELLLKTGPREFFNESINLLAIYV